MARVMAFDYGTKRIGIAVTDAFNIIATPLTTVHPDNIYDFLNNYLLTEKVRLFVVGFPLNTNGENTNATIGASNFAKSLTKKFKIEVNLVDERFSSHYAKLAMIEAGSKKSDRRKKENLDKISATIILQWWMQENEFKIK